MKSREEILKEIVKKKYPLGTPKECDDFVVHNRFTPIARLAMTEYADQFAVELILWCVNNGYAYNSVTKIWYVNDEEMPTADLLTIFKKERGIE